MRMRKFPDVTSTLSLIMPTFNPKDYNYHAVAISLGLPIPSGMKKPRLLIVLVGGLLCSSIVYLSLYTGSNDNVKEEGSSAILHMFTTLILYFLELSIL